MLLRLIFWTTLIALVLGGVQRYGPTRLKQQLLQVEVAHTPKPFKFDNGSVRDKVEALPTSKSSKAAASAEPPPGALRKCARGKEVVYTNVSCPAGYAVAQVSGGTVNVVGGQDAAMHSSTEASAQSVNQARRTLREALDLNVDPALKARMMERAIEGAN